MRIQALGAAATACVFVEAASADNWPQWSGPSANGVSGEKGLPTAIRVDSVSPAPNNAF